MGFSLGDLFVKLGFEVDDSALKSFDAGIKDVFNSITKIAGVAGGAGAFAVMLTDAANTATQIRNLNTELGLNKKEVEGWAAAWHEANPLSSFSEGLQVAGRVGQYIAHMKQGLGGNEAGFFGVTGADNTFEKFNARIRANLQAAIQTWGVDVVSQKLQAIYGTADAINVLTESQEKYNAAAAKGFFAPGAQENLDNYNRAISDLGNELDQLKAKWLSVPAREIADFLSGKNGQKAELPNYKNTDDWFGQRGAFGVLWDSLKAGAGSVTNYKAAGDLYGTAGDALTKMGITKLFFGQSKNPLQQLMGYGNDKDHAQAIIKRLMIESGMNPDAVGDNGKAYGIAQWHPDRQENFKKWSGHDIHGTSVEEQLAFLNYEITKGNERAAGDKFRAARGQDAAYAEFTNGVERPAKLVKTEINIVNNFDGSEDPRYHAGVVNQQVIDTTHAITGNGQVY